MSIHLLRMGRGWIYPQALWWIPKPAKIATNLNNNWEGFLVILMVNRYFLPHAMEEKKVKTGLNDQLDRA